MAEIKTRFNVGEVVYIKDPDRLDPEPLVITDIRIHLNSWAREMVSIHYRGMTDAVQKDFPEAALCNFEETRILYYERHPEKIESIDELPDPVPVLPKTVPQKPVGDIPVAKPSLTKEERLHYSEYPAQYRPF